MYCFRQLDLDAEGRFLRSGRLSTQPQSGSFYVIFRGAFIDSVTHYADTEGLPSRAVLTLSTDENRRLLETMRIEQIDQGPFGLLSLEKDCFFRRSPSEYLSNLGVRSYLNDTQLAVPARLTEQPRNLPALDEVTLLRVSRASSNYLISGATYEANGRLGSTMRTLVKPGGDFISGATSYNRDSALEQHAAEQGLLPSFPLAAYAARQQVALPAPQGEEVKTYIVLRYGFDQLLQVDTVEGGKHGATSYLVPSVAPEDASLNARCDSGLLDQIRYNRGTTF